MDFINQDNYRAFPAVSNSDLTWLQKYWEPENVRIDKEKAYKFGNLLDAMITERHRLNFFNLTVDKVQYTRDEWDRATLMMQAYDKDPLCLQMRQNCNFQHITYVPKFKVEFDGFQFTLPAKCKWDLFCMNMDLGGDIKSTAATTQKQFEEACHYFDYFRSRAWYMDLAGRTNDILIGISKKNNQVFKIPIRRGDKYYNDGKAAYQELAFQYWSLFSGIAGNSIKTLSDAA